MPLLCDILNTGTELTLGRTLNQHGAWLGARLFPLGLEVRRAVTLPDGPILREELEVSLGQADVVVVTGGLGPTSDDLTRDFVAGVLGVGMREDAETLERIRARLAARGRTCGAGQKQQAMVPEGARVLANGHGTAPGLAFIGREALPGRRARLLFLLPGPPAELHPMVLGQVLPILRETFKDEVFTQNMEEYHFAGVGEGELADRMDAQLSPFESIEIGYCAHSVGTVELRLIGSPGLLRMARPVVRAAGGADLFSESGPDLERVVVEWLQAHGETVAVAESCTGGALAARITDVAGASEVFGYGFVVYANSAKSSLLGLDPSMIEAHGAVSEAVAMAMADGALARSGADHAVALTGIAGPGGGTAEKPVGTLWIGLAGAGRRTEARHFIFPGGRAMFKRLAVTNALDLLRRRLLGYH